MQTFIGIDMSCTAKPTSAIAVMGTDGKLLAEPLHFRRAEELAELVADYTSEGTIIAVDAPRTVPDHSQENYAYRSCEKAIKSIDQYAGTFSGAAALFMRWYEIEQRYFQGVHVIETYPRVIWKRLGLPGKPRDFDKNRGTVWAAVSSLIGSPCEGFSHHQVDAVLSAYTAWCYHVGQINWYGDPGEGLIFIPAPGQSNTVPPEAEHVEERFRRFACMR